VRFGALDVEEYRLDLGRIDVYPFDDEHVVGAAHDPADPGHGAATGAGLRDDPGQIPGAVADDGKTFLGEGGDHQFAGFSRRDRFQGIGIDDLDQEVVLVDVQAVAEDAFAGHTGAHDLR